MMFFVALVIVLACGVFMGRLWMDEILKSQEITHHRQMDEIFEEVKRLRAQVAGLVGKE
jgi:hypothetical protein